MNPFRNPFRNPVLDGPLAEPEEVGEIVPTVRVNGLRLWLDREHYLAARTSGDNSIRLAPGSLSEQCESCGLDIATEGNLLGNPGTRRVLGDTDDCAVECVCGQTYEIEWRRALTRARVAMGN